MGSKLHPAPYAHEGRGEILVFIDSDVCVHPDTLARIDAHFRQHPETDAVMGSYDDTPADRRGSICLRLCRAESRP